MLGATPTRNEGLILDFQKILTAIPNGPVARRASSKLQSVSDKDPGFSVLKELSKFQTGEYYGFPEGVESSSVPMYKYVPLTSANVERSFSATQQYSAKKSAT